MQAIVEFRQVSKTYHGVPAVTDVSLELCRGEIHALLGENGAGKSTLTKMLAGVVEISSGEIWYDGERIQFNSPFAALHAGIAMVYQETSLVPSLTVAQNIYLGNEKFYNRLRGLYIAAQQFLQSLNFPVDPTLNVSQLGAAQKQMVEIARAVHHKARVIIFDEPTATLTPEEKQHFFSLVNRLKQSGVTIVFITHALEEALAVSDRITVLRDGSLVVSDDAKKFDRDAIIRAMVGRTLTNEIYSKKERRSRKAGHKVLNVQNLSVGRLVRNSSFSIFAGQITGVFGLIGSGRTEMARVIAGVDKRNHFHGGEIFLDGRPIRYLVPSEAVNDGIAYITEDRKLDGFFETMSISSNIYIGKLAAEKISRWWTPKNEASSVAREWIDSLNIKAISGDTRVIELSGGNQQKVVIAKSLIQNPKLVIFDEPTRGVDVGAIAEIHQLINKLADDGIAVMVISSYLPEILNLSDRILVARKGRIVEEFDAKGVTNEEIMYAAVH
jgi:simple sugar transport system ATP-binding protein